MNKGILIVLLIVLLPLTVFAQEDANSTDLVSDLQDELELENPLEEAEEIIIEEQPIEEEITKEETELIVAEPENLVIETPELVPAGSARDSPFYSLDRFMERLRMRVTRNNVAKAQLRLRFAEERLSEAKKLIEANKQELAEQTITDYNTALKDIELNLESAADLGKDIEPTVQQLSEMTFRHTIVLQKVLEKVPETAKPMIMNAIEISQIGQEKAIQNLAQIRNNKAALEEEIEEIEDMVEEAIAEDVAEEIEEIVEVEDIEDEEITTEETEEIVEEPVEETEEVTEEPVEEETEEEPVEVDTSKGKGWH